MMGGQLPIKEEFKREIRQQIFFFYHNIKTLLDSPEFELLLTRLSELHELEKYGQAQIK
jgi:hypothetical protein